MRVFKRTSILMVVGLTPCLAVAQTTPVAAWPLDSGSRVMVFSSALGPRFVAGRVVSTSTDTLQFQPVKKPGALAVATPKIAKLYVASGTHTQKAKYALVGGLLGAAVGAAVGAATYKPVKCESWCFDFGRGFPTAGGGILGLIAGSITGAIVGSNPTDRWVEITVPRQ